MSPTEGGLRRGPRGHQVWRALIVLSLILGALTLFLSTRLFVRADESIDANRATLCKVGAFLVGTPLIKQPGISHEVFVAQLVKVRNFLDGLQDIDCAGVGAPSVTPQAIEEQLRAIERQIEEHGGTASKPTSMAPQGARGAFSATTTTSTTPGSTTTVPGSPSPTPPGDGGPPNDGDGGGNHGGGGNHHPPPPPPPCNVQMDPVCVRVPPLLAIPGPLRIS